MALVIENTPQDGSGGVGGDTYLAAVAAALEAHPNWTKVDEGDFVYSSYTYKQVWKSAAAGNRNGQDFHVLLGRYSTADFVLAAAEGWNPATNLPIRPAARSSTAPSADMSLGAGADQPLSTLGVKTLAVPTAHQPFITVGASQVTCGLYGVATTPWAGQLELPAGHKDPIGLVLHTFGQGSSSHSNSYSGSSSRDRPGAASSSFYYNLGASTYTIPLNFMELGGPADDWLNERAAIGGRALLGSHAHESNAANPNFRGFIPGLVFDAVSGVEMGDTVDVNGETYHVVSAYSSYAFALGAVSDG